MAPDCVRSEVFDSSWKSIAHPHQLNQGLMRIPSGRPLGSPVRRWGISRNRDVESPATPLSEHHGISSTRPNPVWGGSLSAGAFPYPVCGATLGVLDNTLFCLGGAVRPSNASPGAGLRIMFLRRDCLVDLSSKVHAGLAVS